MKTARARKAAAIRYIHHGGRGLEFALSFTPGRKEAAIAIAGLLRNVRSFRH